MACPASLHPDGAEGEDSLAELIQLWSHAKKTVGKLACMLVLAATYSSPKAPISPVHHQASVPVPPVSRPPSMPFTHVDGNLAPSTPPPKTLAMMAPGSPPPLKTEPGTGLLWSDVLYVSTDASPTAPQPPPPRLFSAYVQRSVADATDGATADGTTDGSAASDNPDAPPTAATSGTTAEGEKDPPGNCSYGMEVAPASAAAADADRVLLLDPHLQQQQQQQQHLQQHPALACKSVGLEAT